MTRRSHRKKRRADEIRQLPWRDVTNPYAPIDVLSADQVETILQSAHQVLETQGFRFLDPGSRQRLAAAGAEVDCVTFYENRRPAIDVAGLRGRLVRGELYALTFTSPSTVDHFVDCLDQESREAAGQCMIAAIGRTTAKHLEAVGLTASVVPSRPDVSLMVEGLVSAAAGE